jgi:hypothetical protein
VSCEFLGFQPDPAWSVEKFPYSSLERIGFDFLNDLTHDTDTCVFRRDRGMLNDEEQRIRIIISS